MERVREAEKVLDLVYVEMEPGDVLFFHPNLLHRSDQNKSDHPRWAMICCYNAARNNPYKGRITQCFPSLYSTNETQQPNGR